MESQESITLYGPVPYQNPPLVSTLIKIKPVHIITHCLCNMYFNIIARLPDSLNYSVKNFMHLFFVTISYCSCYSCLHVLFVLIAVLVERFTYQSIPSLSPLPTLYSCHRVSFSVTSRHSFCINGLSFSFALTSCI
jgi:hypothetical protein